MAFAVVIVAVLTGARAAQTKALGALFQLLIVAQVPFILVFVATADFA